MRTTPLVVLSVLVGTASLAAADTVFFYQTGYGDPSGGEFTAHTFSRGTFLTFCVEKTETVAMGKTYDYEISDTVLFDGRGGGSDPLSDESKKIYYAFRTNQSLLTNALGTTDRDTLAKAVQNALWELEDEITDGGTDAATLITWATNNSVTGADKVKVMNVWNHPTLRTWEYRAQDMLIVVPLPGAAAMAGLGLAGLATRRRRG